MNEQKTIERVVESITRAENFESKLNEEILSLEGMSSRKVRHFLNNLVTDNDRYLEIGTWKGSTLISALYRNNPAYYLAIDNWTEFGGPKQDFFNNCTKFLGFTPNFIEGDCFNIDTTNINNISIYFYDGGHFEEDHYKSITYFYNCLAEYFTLIVDDWTDAGVRKGTRRAIKDTNINILFEQELPARFNGDTENWWNGLLVAYCKK
jgi:hypothetical protein